MQDSDLQELQKDSFTNIILLMVILALVLAYIMLALSQLLGHYHYVWWLPSLLTLLTSGFSFYLSKNDKFRPATYFFTGGLTVATLSFMLWPNSTFVQREVYLLLPIVAIAGLLITPLAALQTANYVVLALVGSTLLVNGLAWENITPLVAPILLTYGIAAVSWLSSSHLTTTLQWAYRNQARAQKRSLELFENQRELQKAYHLLETTNIRLQEAEAAAQQANQFKSRFITNLSHELRTPLSAIINFSFILSRNRHGDVTDAQRDYLNRIQTAGELLLEIVNDLLDLAKIEAGQMDLFIEPVDLAAICHSIAGTTQGLLTDKPVALHTHIAADLPNIYADGTRIRQILLNLMGNAAKYTDQGRITLTAEYQPGPPESVLLSVADTGIGIKEKDFERIFEEFQQADDAFSLRKTGTGLGLPISKKFAELHSGNLWIESRYGHGSTFYLQLPLRATPPRQSMPRTPTNELQIEAINL